MSARCSLLLKTSISFSLTLAGRMHPRRSRSGSVRLAGLELPDSAHHLLLDFHLVHQVVNEGQAASDPLDVSFHVGGRHDDVCIETFEGSQIGGNDLRLDAFGL